MAPSPLLYTASPIVPDLSEDNNVGTKLTYDVAEKTLGLIEEVLESSKASANAKVRKSKRTRDTVKEFVKSRSVGFFTLLAFIAVLIAGVVDMVSEIAEVRECERNIEDLRDACLEAQEELEAAASASNTNAAPPVSLDSTAGAEEEPDGGVRRLSQFADFLQTESVEEIDTDHCCFNDPAPAGCESDRRLPAFERIGVILPDSPTERSMVFTRNRVVVNEYYRKFGTYCRMERLRRSAVIGSPDTSKNWLGAQQWRWLLFVALYFPLGPIAFAIASVLAYIVTSFSIGGRNAAFLAFGLHLRVAWVVRNALWLGAWFFLMWRPYRWAQAANDSNVRADRAAGDLIWDDTFEDAFKDGWRLLLAFLLLSVFALARSGITRALSLRFHHTNHFDQMQKALVQESVVQALSKPNCLPETTVVNSGGRNVVLRGFDNAHWAALKWVSGIIDGGGEELNGLEGMGPESLASIKQRAAQVQMRLAETLSTEWLRHCLACSPRRTTDSVDLQDTMSGVSAGGSNNMNQRADRMNQVQMLDSLDESKPSMHRAGVAGKLPGAGARHRRSAENEMNASGRSPFTPDSSGDAVATFHPTNQSAFNQTSSVNVDFSNPVNPLDFIQSATSQLSRPDALQVDTAGNPGQFWSPVSTARAQARWAGLRMRVKKQHPGSTSSRRSTNSFHSTLQRVVDQKKKEALPDQAADAAGHLAEVQSTAATSSQGEGKKRGFFETNKEDQQSRKAQKLASQLRRASETESSNVNTAVHNLQTYFLSNSNIQVFSLINPDGSIDDGLIKDSVTARKLGYYIFWNLRQEHSGLAVDESEVREAAARAGIRHIDTAWELFDRNCDQSATLEEIVGSVETVFDNRDNLLRTLHDNETVVSQVEVALGILFFIIWMFVTAAIYNADAVQRTWTALSAGLLSFSFIFGNSIREVFENAVFLFFTHPFDVGDAITFEGDRFKVTSISLQYVTLLRLDGAAVHVSCGELKKARIHNITRSSNLWSSISVVVDDDTPTTALEAVGTAVHAVIKANPKWYGGSYRVWWMDSLPGAKKELGIFYDYSQNGLDLLTIGIARTEMFTAVFEALRSMGVEYTLPPVKGGADNGSGDPDAMAAGAAQNVTTARRFAAAQNEQQRRATETTDQDQAAVAQQAILLA